MLSAGVTRLSPGFCHEDDLLTYSFLSVHSFLSSFPPFSAILCLVVLEIKLRALDMLGKLSTTELYIPTKSTLEVG